MDQRLQLLSYSSRLKLHECARKYQLYKLGSEIEKADPNGSQSVTFAFGHVVGQGIQDIFCELSEEKILWNAFLFWKPDLFAENKKQEKSFWHAVFGIQKFIAARKSGYLKDYEIVYWGGKPAVELSFRLELPNGFIERGHVDIVLKHRLTGEILVIDCKTSSSYNVQAAEYKNSGQAIGYSIILDAIFPEIQTFKVMYLVYKTHSTEWVEFAFVKSYLQRAEWIRTLLFDADDVMKYEKEDLFPMRGESCISWGRECEYFHTCTLSKEFITKELTPEEIEILQEKEAPEKYTINLTLDQLIDAQIKKAEQIKASKYKQEEELPDL